MHTQKAVEVEIDEEAIIAKAQKERAKRDREARLFSYRSKVYTVEQWVEDVPAYALSAIINGDYSGLTEEDTENVDTWLAELELQTVNNMVEQWALEDSRERWARQTLVIDPIESGDEETGYWLEPHFNPHPPFGLACDTIKCRITILGPESKAMARRYLSSSTVTKLDEDDEYHTYYEQETRHITSRNKFRRCIHILGGRILEAKREDYRGKVLYTTKARLLK